MSDSIITISPKTSPYRSPLPTELVPSSSRLRNHDQSTMPNEKLQLRKLNDQFLSYIERVRIFETYNHCLTVHCEQIQQTQDRTKTKLDELKQEFNEYQIEKSQREKQDLQTTIESNHRKEKQIEICKTKQTFAQHEHDSYRKKIMELQKKSIDLQTKTEELRFEYENLNDDNNHYRKQLTHYQLLKSSILDEIAHQRDSHQRLQIEIEELKTQKQLATQAYEADTQAMEIRNDNIFYDLTASFRFDAHGKNHLTEMLNEIREEYKIKDQDMRDELQRKYLYEYNQQRKKGLEQNLLETAREDIERRHLSNELNSLNADRNLLQQKLYLIKEHHKQLEDNYQKEFQRQQEMREKYEQQIQQLRSSVQEYENLLKKNSIISSPTVEDEVNKYRQLLEGTDYRIGLRQLVHMSNKLDRISLIHHRPRTPPPPPISPSPPPPPIEKIVSSILTPLILPSLSRENSTSETSYETALISPSSTATRTTQQYLTLESVNEKVFHSDYDTDNDQSQTIQYMSGRSSRLTSETDATPIAMTPNDQESLPPLPVKQSINQDETIVEITIDLSQTADVSNLGTINQTLPFVPMNIVPVGETNENNDVVSDEQQAPIISTLEQRKEEEEQEQEQETGKGDENEKQMIEPSILPSVETIIPITIDIDSKPIEESIESKIISPSTPMMSTDEHEKPSVSPVPIITDQPTEENIVEVPISTLPETNPLAKLISTMIPNTTNNQPISSISISTMNNDAPPFVPSQQPHIAGGGSGNNNQQHSGHWNAMNQRGGGGNRRGQMSGGGFHHGGSGMNQRSGGGGNWQQGGHHNKPRRGGK